jgi:hypothetical protein
MNWRFLSLRLMYLGVGLLFSAPVLSQIAVGTSNEALDVRDVSSLDGEIWLSTTSGAYKILNGQARAATDADLTVNKAIRSIDHATWLATTSGAFRLSKGRGDRIPDQLLDVWTLMVDPDQRVWFGTAQGAYVWNGVNVAQIGPPDRVVSKIALDDRTIWLGSDKGAYRVFGNTVDRVPDTQIQVMDIVALDGEVWIATTKGAYEIPRTGAPREYVPDVSVTHIARARNHIWLCALRAAYQIVNGNAVKVTTDDLDVEDAVEVDGSVWLATHRGAFKLTESGPVRMTDPAIDLKSIKEINGQVWLEGYRGAYVMNGKKAVRTPDVDLEVQKIEVDNGAAWMATTLGAYRLLNTHITAQLVSKSLWASLFNNLTNTPVISSGDVYVRASYAPSDDVPTPTELMSPEFKATADLDQKALLYNVEHDAFVPASTPVLSLGWGAKDIYVAVRDKWNNKTITKLHVFVLPGPMLSSLIVPFLWAAFLVACVILAPRWVFAHDILMNPWLRGIGSFGVIPLILTMVEPARQRVLQRYRREVQKEEVLTGIARRYELPSEDFEPARLLQNLQHARGYFITGQSGIGKTSFLQYLGAYCADISVKTSEPNLSRVSPHKHSGSDNARTQPCHHIPVLIPLVRFQGQKVDDIVAGQLSTLGKLNDRALADWYVKKGGFLFLFGGLNEVDDVTRNDVSRFVDQVRKTNLFCITSQVLYAPFSWVTELQMKYLPPESIRAILASRLTPHACDRVLGQFTDNAYELYKLPQDVEFLLEFVNKWPDSKIPASKTELYAKIVESVQNRWRTDGRADFEDILNKRAYEMVRSRDPSINSASLPVSDELFNPLRDQKLVVPRGKDYYFKHNLIRDYLASLWLRPFWEETLQDPKIEVDANWLEMLKFMLDTLTEAPVTHRVTSLVLLRNRRLAAALFKWLETEHQERTVGWAAEFKIEFADIVLQS